MEILYREKYCNICGNKFVVTGNNQRTCPKCESNKTQPRKLNNQVFLFCNCCGKEFVKTGGNQRSCPDCAKRRGSSYHEYNDKATKQRWMKMPCEDFYEMERTLNDYKRHYEMEKKYTYTLTQKIKELQNGYNLFNTQGEL